MTYKQNRIKSKNTVATSQLAIHFTSHPPQENTHISTGTKKPVLRFQNRGDLTASANETR